MEARFWEQTVNKNVLCNLCPHKCIIKHNFYGICLVRQNIDGKLYSKSYGNISSIHIDPIEKKPLYHYFPGSYVLSIGSAGCNMKCVFCQNCDISQRGIEESLKFHTYSPQELVDLAMSKTNHIGLAYTYNEPLINFEFVFDVSLKIKQNNLKNIIVSNGYIEEKPLKELIEVTDAFNIDLKAFTDTFYRRYTKSSLDPVLKNLKTIRKSGKHLEITNLVIPTLNDSIVDFEAMINWIANELGTDVPLHISKYFPRYKLNIDSTPDLKIMELYQMARHKLDYVYGGNIRSEKQQNTYCPSCHEQVMERSGYYVHTNGLDKFGACNKCGELILENV